MTTQHKKEIAGINAQLEAILELLGTELELIPTSNRGDYSGAQERLDTLTAQAKASAHKSESQARLYNQLKKISEDQAHTIHDYERRLRTQEMQIQRQQEILRRYKKK